MIETKKRVTYQHIQTSLDIGMSQAFVKARTGGAGCAGAVGGGSTGGRQDTIEEAAEPDERKAIAPPVPVSAPAPLVVPAAVQHEAALAELRRDVRNEVQRLQQKLGRVEDLLTALAARLGADPAQPVSAQSSPPSEGEPVAPAPSIAALALQRPQPPDNALARKRRTKTREATVTCRPLSMQVLDLPFIIECRCSTCLLSLNSSVHADEWNKRKTRTVAGFVYIQNIIYGGETHKNTVPLDDHAPSAWTFGTTLRLCQQVRTKGAAPQVPTPTSPSEPTAVGAIGSGGASCAGASGTGAQSAAARRREFL
ncbi:hypothetical protein EVAR_22610_1 [Eumeta japonica]|uniref:Uncharacterized protein n=1 Tax=Eumeta variegata TaxID=151549 RepID=A0A4C1U8R4_EUMVA|nr:hypothetical protein EVAR_22610_1 [Eumeta japonica]